MAPQVSRLLIVFIVMVVAFLGLRAATVPASFGEKGFYRGEALAALASRPLRHAGKQACLSCHQEDVKASTHVAKGISCESCHGPAKKHAEADDPTATKPPRPKSREFCGGCHAAVPGRRANFPQQNLEEHNPGMACTDCHQFHQQETPK